MTDDGDHSDAEEHDDDENEATKQMYLLALKNTVFYETFKVPSRPGEDDVTPPVTFTPDNSSLSESDRAALEMMEKSTNENGKVSWACIACNNFANPVSYTHLTLPTILLV